MVCNAGLPSNIVDVLQQGGWVGCRDGSQGLFVLFYDPWALTISLEEFDHSKSDDPDRPCALSKPTASRKDRAPHSCIMLIQCKTCLWAFFFILLGQRSREWCVNININIVSLIPAAKHFTIRRPFVVIIMMTMFSTSMSFSPVHFTLVYPRLSGQNARNRPLLEWRNK